MTIINRPALSLLRSRETKKKKLVFKYMYLKLSGDIEP